MGNQVKPVRCLLASIGHGWTVLCRTCTVTTCSCRTLGDARIRMPEFYLKVALE